MKRAFAFICHSLVCGVTALANTGDQPTSYLCIEEKSVGFNYDGHDWVPGKLDSGKKILLARSKKPGAAWEITLWQMKFPLIFCSNDIESNGLLFCDVNGDYRFNMTTLRYVEASFQGYLIANSPSIVPPGSAERSSTSIALGSCTPILTNWK